MRRTSITLNIAIAIVLAVAGSESAAADIITDGFEGATISSLWTAYGPGSEVLTNATAYAGAQSVELTASSSYPWYAALTHDFGSAQYGTVSVYVQTGLLCCNSSAVLQVGDLPAGQDTFAAIYRQADGTFFAYNGATFSSSFNSPSPGGWDQLEIVSNVSGMSVLFDGTAVYSSTTETSGFQYVDLAVFGGPGGSEYFDNFSATTSSVAPEPSSTMLLSSGLAALLIWRRIRMGPRQSPVSR